MNLEMIGNLFRSIFMMDMSDQRNTYLSYVSRPDPKDFFCFKKITFHYLSITWALCISMTKFLLLSTFTIHS